MSVTVEAATTPCPSVSTIYAPRGPLDLRATLSPHGRGPHDPTIRWTADGRWCAIRTPAGTATLRLRQRQDAVTATAWGAGAEWLIARLPGMLGRDDDPGEFDAARHPFVREASRRNPGLRLGRTGRVIDALVPAVIEQRVTVVEAHLSWARVVRWFGEDAPGPAPTGLRVAPSTETLRRVPSWEWHRVGIDPARSATLMRVAAIAASVERTAEWRDAERVRAALTSIAGVGAWTAAETMQRSHGDPDAVSVGDYGLPAFVGHALTGSPVDDDGMLELLEPWRGQRQRVVRLILATAHRPPRRAPRAAIPDHRRR